MHYEARGLGGCKIGPCKKRFECLITLVKSFMLFVGPSPSHFALSLSSGLFFLLAATFGTRFTLLGRSSLRVAVAHCFWDAWRGIAGLWELMGPIDLTVCWFPDLQAAHHVTVHSLKSLVFGILLSLLQLWAKDGSLRHVFLATLLGVLFYLVAECRFCLGSLLDVFSGLHSRKRKYELEWIRNGWGYEKERLTILLKF